MRFAIDPVTLYGTFRHTEARPFLFQGEWRVGVLEAESEEDKLRDAVKSTEEFKVKLQDRTSILRPKSYRNFDGLWPVC